MSAAGLALPGALLYSYSAGTLTPLATYTNQGGGSSNANPVVCDAAGQAAVWLGTSSYRMILKTAAGVTVWDVDNISTFATLTDFASTSDVTKGDALIGVNRAETGSVGRTLHYWVKASRRNLCDFLTTAQTDDVLSGTGSIDVSTPFAAALLAASGKFLELPEGRILADNLTVAGTNTTVFGQGNATRISAPTAANNVFTVSGAFAEIRDLKIDANVTRTGGRYVDILAAASRFVLKGFYFDGFLEAIRTAAAATVTIEGGLLLNGVATTGIGVRVSDGLDVTIRDVVMDAAAQLYSGIYVLNVGDLTVEDCNIIHAGQALFLQPGAGQSITSVWANDTFFDNSARGLYAQAVGGAIARCIFEQCWFSSSTNQGALLQTSGGGTIKGTYFNDCQFHLNGADGLYVADTGVTETHVRGGSGSQNTADAIHFAGNVTKFSVVGFRGGASDGLLGNVRGIEVDAGTSSDYLLADNVLTGNTTAPLVDGGTGAGRLIHSNPDYDSARTTYDPASLLDGAGVTATVGCFGAALGDFAEASFSLDLQGILLTAWVSSAAVVSVRFQNETGGTVDLASGTLRVKVSRAS